MIDSEVSAMFRVVIDPRAFPAAWSRLQEIVDRFGDQVDALWVAPEGNQVMTLAEAVARLQRGSR